MADYYFDQTLGNDTTGDGSVGTPWKEMTGGSNKVDGNSWINPGDVMAFKKGETWTLSSDVDLVRSGTKASPITYTSYDTGADPVVDGDGTYSVFACEGYDGIIIDGLTVQNCVFAIYNDGDGSNRTFDYFVVCNCTLSQGGDRNGIGVSISRGSDYLIEDCTMAGFEFGIYISGSTIDPINNGIVRDCIISDSYDDGLSIYPETSGDLSEAGDYHTFDNVTVYGSGQGGSAVGMDIGSGSNVVIRDCTLYDNASGGITAHQGNLGANLGAVTIEGCTFFNTDNTVTDNSISVHARSDVTIKNNWIETIDYAIDIGRNNETTSNVVITDNIIVEKATGRPIHIDVDDDADIDGVEFKRNVVVATGNLSEYIQLKAGSTPAGIGLDCDNNIYFCAGSLTRFVEGDTDYANLAAWQATGQDANSLEQDPLMVNYALGMYWLKPNSPAWALGFKAEKWRWPRTYKPAANRWSPGG